MNNSGEMSITRGVITTISMRWTDRLIAIVSTVILARLLLPEDFGIVAQASLVLALVRAITDLGVNIALIQKRSPDQNDYNTAWTIRIGQLAIVATMVLALAPYAGSYFGDDRVIPVLQILTLTLVLSALENIGVITFQKEMRFNLDFQFLFAKRITAFIVTVTLAVIWRSYWALIIGMITSSLVGTVLSYLMHSMRPQLSISRFKEIFSISQWTLVRSIGSYFDKNIDRLILGARTSSAIVGGYTVANEISAMPSSEILAPINRVLFPAFARAKEDLAELKRIFLLAHGVQSLIAIPAAIGLALVAPEAVMIILGEKWVFAVPFIQILSLCYGTAALTQSTAYLLMSLGQMKQLALIVWLRVLSFFLLAVIILPTAAPRDIALIRLFAALLGGATLYWILRQKLPIVLKREIWRTLYRPLVAVLVMAVIVYRIGATMNLSDGLMLLTKIVAGAATYSIACLVIWLTAGRPVGAESFILSRLNSALDVVRLRNQKPGS